MESIWNRVFSFWWARARQKWIMNDSLSRHPVYAIAATVLGRRFFEKSDRAKRSERSSFCQSFFVSLAFFTWWVRPHSRLASSRWWSLDGRFRPKARQRRSRRSPSALFAFLIKWSSPPFFAFKVDFNFQKFIFRQMKYEIQKLTTQSFLKFTDVDLKKCLTTNHLNWAYFKAWIIRYCRAKSRIHAEYYGILCF